MSKHLKKSKGPRPPKVDQRLDENALSKLTSKIDQSLAANEHKRKKPPTTDSQSQGRKRPRKSSEGQPKPAAKTDEAALLAEIKALGGDEKDLDLIRDVESDEEMAGDDQTPLDQDKRLRDEIAAFSKELGLADVAPSEASEAEESRAIEDEVEEDDNDEHQEDGDAGSEDDDEIKEATRKNFEPRADWHAMKLPRLPKPSHDQIGPFSDAIASLKDHARVLMEQDATKYRMSVFASSSHKFLATIMSTGTLNDKVSALTLAIQESPVHNVRAFDALMNLASKRSRGQAIGAIGALVDLLGRGTVLPSERRLRTFQSQPGLLGVLQGAMVKSWNASQSLPGKMTEGHLISWIYEDWLKETYFKLIQLLESWSSDEIEYSRSRALDFVYGLLKDKPEQESNLLRLLVNKVGDRDRKIASRASYLLLQLQNSHPGMKAIVVRAIEQEILLRPSQDHRAKYYAVNTLNQTILSTKEPAVAEALMRIYFDLFVTLLKAGSLGLGPQTLDGKSDEGETKTNTRPKKRSVPKPSEQEIGAADKLVSAILTGVNRAAPFVDKNDTVMETHLNTLFRIAHSTNFNTGIQALLLIQHLSTSRNLGSDRFYRTLYESLLDPRLVTSSKQAIYLNLLLRALKNDVDVRRVKAFAKRMLQISGLHQPSFVCGLIYVISQLKGTFPDLMTLVQEPEESIFDDEPASARPAYDGRKRDPEHSNAQRSCLWELIPVQAHFHPSVTVFASSLLDRDSKVQKPDLDSHSLIKFLDKFVYRNPKTNEQARGASIMQPLRATKDFGDIWLGSRGAASKATSVNTSAFRNKKSEDVAAEDIFFHEYFQHTAKAPKPFRTGDGGEEDQEDEIWQALVSAQPGVDGAEDSDIGFDDLDEEEMASDDDEMLEDGLEDESDEDLDGLLADEDGDVFDDEDDMVDDDDGSDGLVAVEEDEDGIEIKDKEKDKKKSRRKALKDLPMFASVDDYAELLEADEEESM